jgi:pyruvate/2-oxoglutarate/acetoin dehydrogenase E1 component
MFFDGRRGSNIKALQGQPGFASALRAATIIDNSISENGLLTRVGAVMVGLRPIIEFMTFSFSLIAFDQVVNNAPHMFTMSGGQFNIPITFRGPNGPAHQLGATHSHATENFYASVPGLKVCTPATPRDAKGLLKTAVRDDNPVLVLESELLYSSKGMVEPPDEELLIPLGKAEGNAKAAMSRLLLRSNRSARTQGRGSARRGRHLGGIVDSSIKLWMDDGIAS